MMFRVSWEVGLRDAARYAMQSKEHVAVIDTHTLCGRVIPGDAVRCPMTLADFVNVEPWLCKNCVRHKNKVGL